MLVVWIRIGHKHGHPLTLHTHALQPPLKNAIDWASRPPNQWDDKPAAIVSAGGGLRGRALSSKVCKDASMPVHGPDERDTCAK